MHVGVDVGGTKCLGVLVDGDGTVHRELRRPTPRGEQALLETIAEVVLALGPASSVGVGVPGLVTAEGVLRAAPNLVDTFEVPVALRLTAVLGRPVHVENDNTSATAAEWWLGAGRGADDLVYVGLGTGIGGGIVAGGALQRGRHGFAGEFGHMVVEPDGVRCVCGRRGCWERYASGTALARQARVAAARGELAAVVARAGGVPEAVVGEHVVAAAADGDHAARAVLDEFGRWVALGVMNLVNALDPECVVIGGGLVEAGDLVLGPIRRHLAGLLYAPEHRPHPRIDAAALGERSGAIGAALLAAAAGGRPS